MTTSFNEQAHPRAERGMFTEKTQSAAETSLALEIPTPEAIAAAVIERWGTEVMTGLPTGAYRPNVEQISEMLVEAVLAARN